MHTFTLRTLALLLTLSALSPFLASAQDKRGAPAPVEILKDEKIDVDADLPSVDFIMEFKGLRYQGLDQPQSFLKEIVDSIEKDPF
jgi:hypothetical protein